MLNTIGRRRVGMHKLRRGEIKTVAQQVQPEVKGKGKKKRKKKKGKKGESKK